MQIEQVHSIGDWFVKRFLVKENLIIKKVTGVMMSLVIKNDRNH